MESVYDSLVRHMHVSSPLEGVLYVLLLLFIWMYHPEGGGVPLQPFHATSTTAHHTYIYYSSTVGVERNK